MQRGLWSHGEAIQTPVRTRTFTAPVHPHPTACHISTGLLTPQGTFTIYLEMTQFLTLGIKA